MKNTLSSLPASDKDLVHASAARWKTAVTEAPNLEKERRNAFKKPQINLSVNEKILDRYQDTPLLHDFLMAIQLHELAHTYHEKLLPVPERQILNTMGCNTWVDKTVSPTIQEEVGRMRNSFFGPFRRNQILAQALNNDDASPAEVFADFFAVHFLHRNLALLHNEEFRVAVESAYVAVTNSPLAITIRQQIGEIESWGQEFITLERRIFPDTPTPISYEERLERELIFTRKALVDKQQVLEVLQGENGRLNKLLIASKEQNQALNKSLKYAHSWIKRLFEIGHGFFFDLKKKATKTYGDKQVMELLERTED